MPVHSSIPVDDRASASASISAPSADRSRASASTLPPPAPAQPPTSLKRRVKNSAKRGLRTLFEWGQRLGVDILPRHFYSEVPCIAELRQDDRWRAPQSMYGVHGADSLEQFAFVEACCPPPIVDWLGQNEVFARACQANGEPGFGLVDADFLFAFVHAIRPPKIVQVGCGVSTAIVLRAAEEAGYRPEVVCVEPYPTTFLKESERAGKIRLVVERAQDVPLETLTELGDGGFLFVDSTHTVKPGSEVNRLILEVLPRLKAGSWVHFHDIYFPYTYQRGLLDDELFFCNESALLHAFLINNAQFRIKACLSMLHHADRGRLGESLKNYRPAENRDGLRLSEGDFPGSIYLEVQDR